MPDTIGVTAATGHLGRLVVDELLERLRTLVIVSRVGDAAADVLPEVPQDAFERLRHQASRFGHAELSRAADVVAAALGEERRDTCHKPRTIAARQPQHIQVIHRPSLRFGHWFPPSSAVAPDLIRGPAYS